MSKSITVPNTFAVLSRTPPILGDANNKIPKHTTDGRCRRRIDTEYDVKAHGRAPMLPILNARPPREIKNATK